MNQLKLESILGHHSGDTAIIIKNMSQSEIMHSRNLHLRMRSASIIKLFILSKCAKDIDSGLLSKDQIIHITDDMKVPFSLITDLSVDAWRLDDIATLMIVLSDNTATNVLIDLLGIDAINMHIQELGYKHTILQRKMMDFESAKKGLENYTSLHDVCVLMEDIYSGACDGREASKWMMNILAKQKDRTMLGRYLPESVEIANKTGLNDGVQHDIGFMSIGGITYLIGVFLEGQADEIEGFECIGKIAKVFYEEVQHGI